MKFLKFTVLPILLAGIWISISEFVRNEFLFKSYWTDHYQTMGLIFPSEPINGAVWGIWSFIFAGVIFSISKKFSFFKTFLLSWIVGFILMWLVTGNMGVLPLDLLSYAVPLSMVEVLVAQFIIKKLTYKTVS